MVPGSVPIANKLDRHFRWFQAGVEQKGITSVMLMTECTEVFEM
jgi:hypothetical protein